MKTIMMSFLGSKKENYYRHNRSRIAEIISFGDNSILDVGCGSGSLGLHLKETGKTSKIIGIECNEKAFKEAVSVFDHVYKADLNLSEVSDVLSGVPRGDFDYIICADILEHLIDPWHVLKCLSTYLSSSGKIIVSIPNVRHWTVIFPLILRGRWDYQETGIMDRTHLRFFTRSSMYHLFNQAEIKVTEVFPLIGGKSKLADKYSFHLFTEFFAKQWLFVGGKIIN